MSEPQGTESLLQLAGDLRSTAPNVRSWFDHTKAAMLMERAAIEAAEKVEPVDFKERLIENARMSNELGYSFPQPAIPAGWKLVPIDPTDRMLEAGLIGDARYARMLAAAPKPENSHE